MSPAAALLSLLFSGISQAAISPPLGWILLHPLSWVPAFAVFSTLRGRRAFFAGWLVGLSAELAIYCWLPGTVTRFGGYPIAVGILIGILFAAATGAYTAVFAWGFARMRRIGGAFWPFAIAAWFCALEFLNPQLFGYLQGVAWYQVPALFLVVAATGISGVSFLVVLCNALALQGIELARGSGTRRAWLTNVSVFAGLVAAALAFSASRLDAIEEAERSAEPVRLAIVQPNHTIPHRFQLERSGPPEAFATDLVALSREAAAASPAPVDVFVWPEGALRSDPSQKRHASVLEFARESGSEIWTGANHYEREGKRRSHNSAFRIFPDGRLDRRYDKNVLVPFGEYVPLANLIPLLRRIHTVGNFEAGTSVPVYERGHTRFIFLICYEAIRSGFVRDAIGRDVNLIVNVTTDAWYGELSEQSQHLMLAAAQSALHGIPLVRSTSTGLSAFVDARGVMTAVSGNFTREALVRELRPMRLPGLYSRWGDWFAWACVVASAVLLLASRRRPT